MTNSHLQGTEYLENDERIGRKVVRADESLTREDSEPFREDVRTLGDILAWMHSKGINAVGFPTTEMEKRECSEGRCRCLGPMMRDV